jgi:hypothetical protein
LFLNTFALGDIAGDAHDAYNCASLYSRGRHDFCNPIAVIPRTNPKLIAVNSFAAHVHLKGNRGFGKVILVHKVAKMSANPIFSRPSQHRLERGTQQNEHPLSIDLVKDVLHLLEKEFILI